MGKDRNPGPPLTVDGEFCVPESPGLTDHVRGLGMALLIGFAGAAGWFAAGLTSGRTWSLGPVFIGLLAGWAVNRAANRRRSRILGRAAAAATLSASLVGHGLLWLPFVEPEVRTISWYHGVMLLIGAYIARRLAGPSVSAKH